MTQVRESGKAGNIAGPPSGKTAGLRSCSVCRTRSAAHDLIRFTNDGSTWHCVVPGTTQLGRGVSLCPNPICFERACTSRKSRFASREAHSGSRPAAGPLLSLAIDSYQERILLLRRSGGHQAAETLDKVLSQLHTALLTLPPCRSGETHVR